MSDLVISKVWKRDSSGRLAKETKSERIESFFSKMDKSDSGCWIWKGSKVKAKKVNYGQIWNGKKTMLAHRFSYELFVGNIPDGMTIDHKCNNGLCVNPDHLQVLSLKDNILRSVNSPSAINSRKTHCLNGHEFTKENTVKQKNGRQCRTCLNAWYRKYRRSKARRKE